MMLRTLSIFFVFLFLRGLLAAQFNCPSGLIYGRSPNLLNFIRVYDTNLPGSATNPSNTAIPVPQVGQAGGLALMPNINGGTLSPTFYATVANTVRFWDGTNWINTGHSAGPDFIAGITGCNGALYSMNIPNVPSPSVATIYKYTGSGPAVALVSVTYYQNDITYDLITDCYCNFYVLTSSLLRKYDTNGNLLSSTPVSGLPPAGYNSLASVGNTLYITSNSVLYQTAVLNTSTITFGNAFTLSGVIAGEDFASCPVATSDVIVATVNSATLGCHPNTASLAATSTLSPLNYTWAGPGLLGPANASVVTINAPGIYTCVLTQGTCDYNQATLITTVVSNVTPVAPVITPSTNLCLAPNQQLFSSLTPTLYINQWQGPSVTGGANSATVNIGAPGIYTLTTTNISNGCTGTATANILPVPNVSLGLSSSTLCVFSSLGSNSITLSSAGASHYTLLASPGFTFNTQPSQPVAVYLAPPFPAGGAVGSAMLIGSNGVCTGSASAGFSVLPVTKISASPSATAVCQGNSQRLSASGAVTYTWLPPEGISPYNDSTVVALIGGPTIYSVVGTDVYGCNSLPETVSLSVHPLHTGSLTHTIKSYCAPFAGDLNFISSSLPGNVYNSEWAVNNTNYSRDKFSYLFKEPGTYTINIKVTDSLYQCSNTLRFFVEAYPKPRAEFSYSPAEPDEMNSQVLFSPAGNAPGLSYEWNFINNKTAKSKEQYASYLFDKAGIYPVALVVKNTWGCSDTVVKAIGVKEDFGFYIPNAFTPNTDGKNDLFLPLARSIKFYNMKIFDRWGQLIFETNDLSVGWDGSYKGALCKNDSYIWKVELSTNQGEMKTLHGTVVLVK